VISLRVMHINKVCCTNTILDKNLSQYFITRHMCFCNHLILFFFLLFCIHLLSIIHHIEWNHCIQEWICNKLNCNLFCLTSISWNRKFDSLFVCLLKMLYPTKYLLTCFLLVCNFYHIGSLKLWKQRIYYCHTCFNHGCLIW
jgi:hypothetical protein